MDVSKVQAFSSSSIYFQESRVLQNSSSKTSNFAKQSQISRTDRFEISFNVENLSDAQVNKWFAAFDPEDLKEKFEEIQKQYTSQNEEQPVSLEELHSLNDPLQEERLRRLLRQIDQENDIQDILFNDGKKATKSSSSYQELKEEFSIEFNLKVEKTQSESLSSSNYVDLRGVEFESKPIARKKADPLIFDLNGDGIKSTGIENGISFDLDADGIEDKVSFVSGDDFALALDKNNDGLINSGYELFGDQSGAADGIEELRKYDSNQDNVIDENDPIFNQLVLVNKDQSPLTLDAAQIKSIALDRIEDRGFTNMNDEYNGALSFTKQDGSKSFAKDLWFNMA